MKKDTTILRELLTEYGIASVQLVNLTHHSRYNGASVELVAWTTTEPTNESLQDKSDTFDIEMVVADLLHDEITSDDVRWKDFTSLFPDQIFLFDVVNNNLRDHPDQYIPVDEDDTSS